MTLPLNDGWQFFNTWQDSVASGSCQDGTAVRLPHCNVQTPHNCFPETVYEFVSGYSKTISLDKFDDATYLITFEGVAHYSQVYFNGQLCASHGCGYTAFTVDVTQYVRQGDNLLAVKVDSRESLDIPPFGNTIDYLTYGGIYREVTLCVKRGVYVADVFVKATLQNASAAITFGNFVQDTQYTVAVKDGKEVLHSQTLTAREKTVEVAFDAQTLTPWDIDNPKLYTFEVTTDSDVFVTRFGVRTAVFTKHGFYLNGKRVKIVGLNRHQSFPYVGYAMPQSMQRHDAEILKNELCVNAVRTSHYPQSRHFLDACDELGLFVFTEIAGWQHIGGEQSRKQALANVQDMVLQNRNHPSVVLWGVRINESLDCDELYMQTNKLAHTLDPTRQTGGVRYLRHSHLLEDVYTYNDFNRDGASARKNVCGKNAPYLVTEYNGHMFPTKTFDSEEHRLQHMLKYARMLDGVFADEDVCGAFGWCMFDYNTHADFGSGDRICYHGVTDMFRNPKYAAGVFSSQGKSDFLSLCFVTDKGDYAESVSPDMYCLTNADEIKLYSNGKFVKSFTHKNSPFKHLPNAPILIDDVIGNRLTEEEGISPCIAQKIKRIFAEIKKSGEHGVSFKTKL
ncbi:MAG: hypothetical protein NC350_03475, partial [Corallococcus sp.]|nr:hypothetical protein [Corallococcus sp.]